MPKTFLLFGEKPFDAYVADKFSYISNEITLMSDIEVIMYKECFHDLVSNQLKSRQFPELHISFENKVVDLVGKPTHQGIRYYAEYSLEVRGNPYFLGLSPFNSGYLPVNLQVEARENVLTFRIDTEFYSEELDAAATARVKKEYERIKKFINGTQETLNQTIRYYNRELEKHLIHQLAEKLRKAERVMKIRQVLDFK